MFEEIIKDFIENEKIELLRYCSDKKAEEDFDFLETITNEDIKKINIEVENKINDILYDTIKKQVYDRSVNYEK